MINENEDLLDDNLIDETVEQEYFPVSRGKRFGHNLLDGIPLVFANMGIEYLYFRNREEDFFYDSASDPGVELLLYVISYLVMVGYFTCTEYFLDGKSFGKYVTNTRVVRVNGEALTFSRVLGRSLGRIIPFEAFSIFFNEENKMWHDSLSDTIVVED